MNQHTINISDNVYQMLARRATQENRSLEQVAESLLSQELFLDIPAEENVAEALAAVHRLSTLFADVDASLLERVLDDPLIELANVDLAIYLP
ncbi:MAG: hypothetical protein HND44_20355 [Chloroflexi bacterium]|nr:hypothetical protein [Ardenticatenaceae bacterium]MBL1130800.1 hypothetical protein [Chloroflexota bacterium]NOG36896.1 hypothetical protein [Chloroflexota bacterium]GIK58399.1 MAG: hypothetical protein BroJett015_40620 [Chloroflexota bacterium]